MKRIVILIFVLTIILSACQSEKPVNNELENESEQAKLAVEVASAELQNLTNKTVLAGIISGDELVILTPNLMMPATIKEVRAEVGDWVNIGDILLTFKVNGIDDQITLAKAQYDLALANYNMQMDNYNFALDNLERTRILYQNGAVSKLELEQAELRASGNQINTLQQQLNQAKSAYDIQLSKTKDKTLVATVSGRVTAVNATIETAASPQTSVAVIKDGKLKVKFSLPESLKNELTVGEQLQVVLKADQSSYSANLTQIAPAVNPKTAMFDCLAVLNLDDSADSVLSAGMNVDVVLVDKNTESLVIPVDAVKKNGEESYVFIAKDGIAKKQVVQTAFDNGEIIEIIDGLALNDKVVVVGQDFLKDGQAIEIVGGE